MELSGNMAIEKVAELPPFPFYIAHGGYEFLAAEFAAAAVAALIPDPAERSGAVLKFDFDDGGSAVDAWAEAAGTPSLFASTQVLIVDNADIPALKRREEAAGKSSRLSEKEKFTNWDSYARFERIVQSPLDGISTIFICSEEIKFPKEDSGGRIGDRFIQRAYRAMRGKRVTATFPKMWEDNLVAWLAARVRVRGMEIRPEAAEFFLHWAGTDLRHLANEVEKLYTRLGEGGKVTEKVIREMASSSQDQYVYQIFDCAMEGDGAGALRYLDMSLAGAAEPLQILASLAGVMRDMWQARHLLDKGCFRRVGDRYIKKTVETEAAAVPVADRDALSSGRGGLLGSSAFKVYHAVRRAKKLPIATIERIMDRILDIECRMKAIRRPPCASDEIVLQQLISDLTYVVRREAAPRRRGTR